MGWSVIDNVCRTWIKYLGSRCFPRQGEGMMSNMRTMFDLNQIDSQGAGMNTSIQESQNSAINAIEVRNLNFFYGSFQGLKKINLDIEQGKVTAFIGPSGCGKSTLLRTLNRMYDLYPGQRAEGEINF